MFKKLLAIALIALTPLANAGGTAECSPGAIYSSGSYWGYNAQFPELDVYGCINGSVDPGFTAQIRGIDSRGARDPAWTSILTGDINGNGVITEWEMQITHEEIRCPFSIEIDMFWSDGYSVTNKILRPLRDREAGCF